jgi:hypothetical protein
MKKSNYCNPKALTPCMMNVDGTMGGVGHVMELSWCIWVGWRYKDGLFSHLPPLMVRVRGLTLDCHKPSFHI